MDGDEHQISKHCHDYGFLCLNLMNLIVKAFEKIDVKEHVIIVCDL